MRIALDRAVYHPGDRAAITVGQLPAGASEIKFQLCHLDEIVLEKTAGADEKTVSLALPERDFTGYLLIAQAADTEGRTVDAAMTGVDCSSVWTKFPRYGYVWDYGETVDAREKISRLARYHINGVQFYDWQYRHHIPVSPDTEKWRDWSGREISGSAVRAYLEAAHQMGMAAMNYNMIYAANQSYRMDGSGVDASWRLVRENGKDFTCDMDASRGPVGVLQYFNPLNPAWQQYIFAREREVFAAFPFDGWHGDTIGEMGPMRTAEGGPLGYDENGAPITRVKDTYTQFLNAAKAALGEKFLAFNPVGAQGIENVNRSRVDVLYTEFWPWDRDDRGMPYDDYYSIHRAILRACEQSGGKSLVVAGYINYKHPAETFNAPAVRLMDSVAFASGGARIELGNGDGMLSNEYFPDDRHKKMDGALRLAVQRMYDFIVAYENLLRDGQHVIKRETRIGQAPVSADGRAGTVWCFAKADAEHEIYHFINLMGTDSGWRDTEQTKQAPVRQADLAVTIFTDFPVKEVCLASPDTDDLTVHSIPFEKGGGKEGAYISFTLPCLDYWDMVFLR
ncbi:MAG: glycoside hydrolase family 66 protein [Clostridia bacterium]|nr:glycoside hydrolase family 66 protein [Clostridia bacterium]